MPAWISCQWNLQYRGHCSLASHPLPFVTYNPHGQNTINEEKLAPARSSTEPPQQIVCLVIQLWEVICFKDRKFIFPHSFLCLRLSLPYPFSLASCRWQASLWLFPGVLNSQKFCLQTNTFSEILIKKYSPFKADRNTLLGEQERSIEQDLEESSLTCGAAEDGCCLAGLGLMTSRSLTIIKLNYCQRDFFPPNI